MAQGGSRFMLPRTKKLDRSRASDRSYAYARAARGRSAYFRNHLTSERRAYFRLAGQLSQLCAQTLHIFAYYPRTAGWDVPRLFRSNLYNTHALHLSQRDDEIDVSCVLYFPL